MKLIIVLGMQEHQTDLSKMFKDANTPIYSKVNVEGFKTGSKQVDLANWFGDSIDGDMSIMFFAFVPKQNAENIMKKVTEFNADENRISPLHAFQLPVEKFI
jgi:hypothetical protein